MKLYLMQHGLSKSKQEDSERSLSDAGKLEVEKIAGFLAGKNFQPGAVWCSEKKRSRQTAEIMAASLKYAGTVMDKEFMVPDGDVVKTMQAIETMSSDLLLVGHLPHLNSLLSWIVVGRMDAGPVRFQNAAVICLEKAEHNWQISWMLPPFFC